MKSRILYRLACVLLAVCLLPVSALAALGDIPLTQPITCTDFTVSLGVDASAFPQSNNRHADWESFLSRIAVTGTAACMDMLGVNNRLHLLADVTLDGKSVLPLQHEQYCNYFYIMSPMFGEDILHFQMDNFFNFMLKPYFFMGLSTQYLALLMYPQATTGMIRTYYNPLAKLCEGDGERVVSYETLRAACLEMDEAVNSDWNARTDSYIRALLIDVGGDDMTLEGLGALENYLDYLDPEKAGLTVRPRGNQTEYLMGGRTLLTVKRSGEAFAVALALPHPDGYELTADVNWTPTVDGAQLAATLHILNGTDDALLLTLAGEGLPCSGNLEGEGTVTLSASGYMVGDAPAPTTLRCTWQTDTWELPRTLRFTVGWLHPETGREAITLSFVGAMREGTPEEIDFFTPVRDDFFNLNNDRLEEFKDKYLGSIGLTLAPLALQAPAGVVDSVIDFLLETDILNAFGLGY